MIPKQLYMTTGRDREDMMKRILSAESALNAQWKQVQFAARNYHMLKTQSTYVEVREGREILVTVPKVDAQHHLDALHDELLRSIENACMHDSLFVRDVGV